MKPELEQLYRDAITTMNVSEDERIERLRRSWLARSFEKRTVSPKSVADEAQQSARWGDEAFDNLYATGFIETDWLEYFWFAPKASTLSERMSALAGMEAMAIIRLSSMDCGPALPGITARLLDFEEAARSGDWIKTSLARQRLMMAIVAAIGPQQLTEDYLKTAKVAIAYAASAQFDETFVAGMRRSARNLVESLGDKNARDCAAEAVAMRLHPEQPIHA